MAKFDRNDDLPFRKDYGDFPLRCVQQPEGIRKEVFKVPP